MSLRCNRPLSLALLGSTAALALPSAALAATAPTVSTGGASQITQSTAKLSGSVNPKGSGTTIYFEIGPTKSYGAATPSAGVGAGTSAKAVSAIVGALAPATTYHYRLVAQNSGGLTRGADRTFKSAKQPLGLVLSATPNPVVFGHGATLNGNLSGTGNANQTVVFQQKGFPFSSDFTNVGSPVVTDQAGNFSLPLLTVGVTTQYRVVLDNRPDVVSPILTVPVAVLVSTRVSHKTVTRGAHVRFSGIVRPGSLAAVAIQKLRGTSWITVGGTITHRASATASRYGRTITVKRSGTYRVFVGVEGAYTSNVGRTVRITAHKKK